MINEFIVLYSTLVTSRQLLPNLTPTLTMEPSHTCSEYNGEAVVQQPQLCDFARRWLLPLWDINDTSCASIVKADSNLQAQSLCMCEETQGNSRGAPEPSQRTNPPPLSTHRSQKEPVSRKQLSGLLWASVSTVIKKRRPSSQLSVSRSSGLVTS